MVGAGRIDVVHDALSAEIQVVLAALYATMDQAACSLELSAVYFQSASSVFLSHKPANSIFSRLFSAQALYVSDLCWNLIQ
jgi:hypothetical protein